MKTAIINVKTNPSTKVKAQEVASKLGLSVSSLINGFLSTLIQTKSVHFRIDKDEQPTPFMAQALENAWDDVQNKRVSPRFNSAEASLKWLRKESQKYAR